MGNIFITILNMSLSAGIVILVILLARLALRKAPKKWSYLLWIAAAFRLCCPVSFSSAISLFRFAPKAAVRQSTAVAGRLEYFSAPASSAIANAAQTAAPAMPAIHSSVPVLQTVIPVQTVAPAAQTAMPAVQTIAPAAQTVAPAIQSAAPAVQAAVPAARTAIPAAQTSAQVASGSTAAAAPDIGGLLLKIGAALFLAGMAALLIYGIINYVRMHKKLVGAMLMKSESNGRSVPVYMSDAVDSPFILGIFRPRIYIPFGLDGAALSYVLAHERFHLKRRDHIVKCFAFILLALHWFNPLCWLAFYLMSKDMEMSCDEAVLKKNVAITKAYSKTLLGFAAEKHAPAPNPLAFGESAVRSRIKNVMSYKKPKLLVTMISIILSAAVIAACAFNPAATSGTEAENTNKSAENATAAPTPKPSEAPATEQPTSAPKTDDTVYDEAWFVEEGWKLAQEISAKYGVEIPKDGDHHFDFYGTENTHSVDFGIDFDDASTPVQLVVSFEKDGNGGWRISYADFYERYTQAIGEYEYREYRTAIDTFDMFTSFTGAAQPDYDAAAAEAAEEAVRRFLDCPDENIFKCTDGGVISVEPNENESSGETLRYYTAKLALLPVDYANLRKGYAEAMRDGLCLDEAFPEYRLYATLTLDISVSVRADTYLHSEVGFPVWDWGETNYYSVDFNFPAVGKKIHSNLAVPGDYFLRAEKGGETREYILVPGPDYGGYVYDYMGNLVGSYMCALMDDDCPIDNIEWIYSQFRSGRCRILLEEMYEPVEHPWDTTHAAITLAEGVNVIEGQDMAANESFLCDAIVAYDAASRAVIELVFEKDVFSRDTLEYMARLLTLSVEEDSQYVSYGDTLRFHNTDTVYGCSFTLPAGYTVTKEKGDETRLHLNVSPEFGGYIYDESGNLVGCYSADRYDDECPDDNLDWIYSGFRLGQWHIMTEELYWPVTSPHSTVFPALTLAEAVDFDGSAMASSEHFICDAVIAYDTSTHVVLELAFDYNLFTSDQLIRIAQSISTEITTMGSGE